MNNHPLPWRIVLDEYGSAAYIWDANNEPVADCTDDETAEMIVRAVNLSDDAQADRDIDKDGYPTEYALKRLREWDAGDIVGWFGYATRLWGPDKVVKRTKNLSSLSTTTPQIVREFSTGGWSGNEEVIEAMCQNTVLWTLTWQSSRRGGHYTFEYAAKLEDAHET